MFKRFLLLALFAMAASAQTLQIPVGTFNPPLTTIRNGAGAPSNTIGNNGDWYIDTSAHVLYGPKAAGAWPGSGIQLSSSGSSIESGTLAARPATCTVGNLYFALDAVAGSNLFLCTATDTWTLAAGGGTWGTIGGTLAAQTDLQNALNAKQAAGSYLTGLQGDVTASGPGLGTATLKTVNPSPGTYGDGTNIPVITVDAQGRATAVSTIPIAGQLSNPMTGAGDLIMGGTSGTPVRLAPGSTNGECLEMVNGAPAWGPCSSSASASSLLAGALASLPTSCAAGDVYFATDQPAGQQLYQCSAVDTWTQSILLGGSGALQVVGGALDINPDVVPQKGTANIFTAYNTFQDGLSLLTTEAQPACSASNPGLEWFTHDGVSADSLQVCEFDGTAYGWHTSGSTSGGITALTGDVTASGTGSVPATLATVNSAPGECGDGTHVCQVTTDGKGRVTNQTAVAISEPGGSIVNASNYNWSQTPGGSLTAATVATVTLAPCPVGVNGSDTNLWVYLSGGTGTAEAVEVSGGTCTSGAASGTVQFTPANSHTGAWTISSATAGIYEAVMGNQWRSIYIPAGHYAMHACINLDLGSRGLTVFGDGAQTHESGEGGGTDLDFSGLSCDAITITNNDINWVRLSNFSMRGSYSTSGGNGLVFPTSTELRVSLSGMQVEGFAQDGVKVNGVYELLIEDGTLIQYNGHWGLDITGLANVDTIRDSYVNANSEGGNYGNVKIDGSSYLYLTADILIVGSNFEHSGQYPFSGASVSNTVGLSITKVNNVTIMDNWFERNVGEHAITYGTGVNSITEFGNYIGDGAITYSPNSKNVTSYNNTFDKTGTGIVPGSRVIPAGAPLDTWRLGPDSISGGAHQLGLPGGAVSQGLGGSAGQMQALPTVYNFYNYPMTAAIAATTVKCGYQITCPLTMYRVTVYLYTITTGTGTADLSFTYTDPGGTQHTVSAAPSLDLTSKTVAEGSFLMMLDGSHDPTYTVSATGIGGGAQYGYAINVEMMQ